MQSLLTSLIQFSFFASSHLVAKTYAFVGPAPTLLSARRLSFSFQEKTEQSLFSALTRIPEEESQEPVPFVDSEGSSFIECYADSLAELDGIRYTIGIPCDHSVALCYFNNKDELVPVELEEKLMDDVFPIVESIVSDEFGEELILQRTPQTLTLVGELDDEEEDFDNDDEGDGEDEEVEELLSFEHEGKEYKLVRLLDPVLLVGKDDEENDNRKILLTPQESMKVMPRLEEMFSDNVDEDE